MLASLISGSRELRNHIHKYPTHHHNSGLKTISQVYHQAQRIQLAINMIWSLQDDVSRRLNLYKILCMCDVTILSRCIIPSSLLSKVIPRGVNNPKNGRSSRRLLRATGGQNPSPMAPPPPPLLPPPIAPEAATGQSRAASVKGAIGILSLSAPSG
jgi:hypothetical protein